jgi:hypothetical protein
MLNVALIRITQLISCVFFTAIFMVYAGGLLLLPLAVIKGVVGFLTGGLGFNGVFATIVVVPLIAWIALRFYRIAGLTDTVIDTGWALIKLGADNFRRFDAIAALAKGHTGKAATSTGG